MRWWRRTIVLLAALALLAAGAGSAVGAGGERANRRAAQRDAARLVKQAVLPADAIPSAGEPAGDQHYLSRPGQVPDGLNVIDRHRWWTVPEDETTVSQFVYHHRPKDTRGVTEGIGDGIGLSTDALTFQLPSAGRSLGTRWLVFALINLPNGQTGVRVDAEVQWLVPRPAGERIPRGARTLEVVERRPGRPATTDVSVTGGAKIRRIWSLINGLETVQPGVFDCIGKADDPVVTFTFRAAPGGRVLARAAQIMEPSAPHGSCEPMTLTISGRAWSPLLGGTGVVRAAQRLLGIRLGAG